MISVKDLTLTLNNTIVLDHVSAEFAEGTVTGLVGRNGSGKTVLMKCICGFFKPDSGSVSVGGKIVGRDMDFPEDLGIIIEAPGFLGHFSGYENLKLLAMIRHRIGKNPAGGLRGGDFPGIQAQRRAALMLSVPRPLFYLEQ